MPDAVPTDLRLAVVRASDGDPALADALRQMLWDDYCRAGRPLGPDEDGMWAWWTFERTAQVH